MSIQFHRHRIVPGHAGGTYADENVVRVNVSMHAFLHEQLWQKHGHIEDRLACDGLRGLISKAEIVAQGHRIAAPKISAAMTGKRKSEDHKAKLSKSLKGRKLSVEHRANVVKALIGRTVSAETRMKMSASQRGKHTGRAPWNKGQSGYHVVRTNGIGWHHSEEWKAKISARMVGNRHARRDVRLGQVRSSCDD